MVGCHTDRPMAIDDVAHPARDRHRTAEAMALPHHPALKLCCARDRTLPGRLGFTGLRAASGGATCPFGARSRCSVFVWL